MTQIHVPTGMRYSCVQCGKSCGMFDEIGLEPASLNRLEEMDWRALAPGVEPGQLGWREVEGGGLPALAKQPDGRCVFLCGESLNCRIHACHGAAAKPQACQDFPWRYVETPGGVFAGLSFACTAVLENSGRPVEDQQAEISAGYGTAVSRRRADGAVMLAPRVEISWPAYRALEADLLAILAMGDHPMGLRLVAQGVYLDMVVELLRQARTTGAEPDDGAVVRAVGQRFVAGAGAERLLGLARRARGTPALHRALVGLLVGFRQNLQRRGPTVRQPSRVGTALAIMGHYSAAMLRVGRVRLAGVEGSFPYGDFRGPHGAALEVCLNGPLMERFLRHCIERKDLLLAESVWLGHRAMGLHHALVRWYTVGLASAAGVPPGPAELAEAIRLVELRYGFHVDLRTMLDRIPMMGPILASAARRPTFLPSVVGAPV